MYSIPCQAWKDRGEIFSSAFHELLAADEARRTGSHPSMDVQELDHPDGVPLWTLRIPILLGDLETIEVVSGSLLHPLVQPPWYSLETP